MSPYYINFFIKLIYLNYYLIGTNEESNLLTNSVLYNIVKFIIVMNNTNDKA